VNEVSLLKVGVRYTRAFLQDLSSLKAPQSQKIRQFIFKDFLQLEQLYDLPELHQMGEKSIFYRFTLDHYFVAIEVTGEIVKFLRILPKPNL
jgi:mRNA-degrading endonuclease RelE of RelBE toxin-antitoxin system